jgi:hypothetical protein
MTLKASRLLASRNLTYVNQSGANKIADVIGLVGRIDNGETSKILYGNGIPPASTMRQDPKLMISLMSIR